MQAIILAGGKGTRLKPFTTNFPKPLVPVGDVPILEIVLRQLKHHGFTDIVLAVNHFAELIMAFFGDGRKLGLNITYSVEDKELGTAGPLALIDGLEDNFLVMNGDILTTLDYRDLFEYHVNHGNDITISSYRKEVKIDLGVLEIEETDFKNYLEKPSYFFDVSMGIYLFRRNIISSVPRQVKLDMPDFILKCRDEGKKIGCYRGDYEWLDIGRIDDYEKAIEMFSSRKSEFLFDE